MDEDSEDINKSISSNPTSSSDTVRGFPSIQNCSTTFIQQSLPNLFSRNKGVIAQPQTIPPTPPPNSNDLSSPLPDDTSLMTSRTQLLSVSQMVRQQSDTTNNRRLIRSTAICDDRPATSSNKAITVQVRG
jgi:hypothetical protein